MKSKIVTNYIYDGLGFPVELAEVEMVYLDNDWPLEHLVELTNNKMKLKALLRLNALH